MIRSSSKFPFLKKTFIHVITIHETEIKQFRDRNDRNRVEIISTLSHKSQIVKTNYEGQNRLRGSKVETNYEGQNRLRGSKVETNYEGQNRLRGSKVEMNYEGQNRL